MKKCFYLIAAACMFASVSCNKQTPSVVPTATFSLKGNISDNYARIISFIDKDTLGVFVAANGFAQTNLRYVATELGEYEDYGTMVVIDKLAPASPFKALADTAKFAQGEHTVVAYMPYVAGASVDAVPVKDMTVQDVVTENIWGKYFLPSEWFIEYAKVTVSSAAFPLEFNFKCPYTHVNNGANRSEYFALPEDATANLDKIVITADAPIAYKNPSFNLLEEKFNGEAVNTIEYTAKKSSTQITSKFAICCDKATALNLNFTVDVHLADGSVYTAKSKLEESTIPDPVDWEKDIPSVKFPALTFTKK